MMFKDDIKYALSFLRAKDFKDDKCFTMAECAMLMAKYVETTYDKNDRLLEFLDGFRVKLEELKEEIWEVQDNERF